MWQVPEPSQVTAVETWPSCCSVAHYLFPTQWQHQESPPLINQYCVWSQRLKQLGWFADTPSCWRAQRLWWPASTGSAFWSVETLLLHTGHNGHAWEPVQCRTKQTDAFSFILVITVSVIVIWSFLLYLKMVTLFKVYIYWYSSIYLDQQPLKSLSSFVQTLSKSWLVIAAWVCSCFVHAIM